MQAAQHVPLINAPSDCLASCFLYRCQFDPWIVGQVQAQMLQHCHSKRQPLGASLFPSEPAPKLTRLTSGAEMSLRNSPGLRPSACQIINAASLSLLPGSHLRCRVRLLSLFSPLSHHFTFPMIYYLFLMHFLTYKPITHHATTYQSTADYSIIY